ncbi:MAG: exosortase system-associated protein, TIGR04073 family [Terrimicrobiaceae bacterium]|nr:exosortase system-associated protein, TIGR04073 family [Terrimicrobiaceae bacterium]
MKFPALLVLTFAIGASVAFADIQSPPGSDYGPTRKLGRGISNIAFGSTEFIVALTEVNYQDGNSAMWSYGVVRGLGRTFARLGFGLYETALFPFPIYKGSYRPPYKSDIPWIHCGYAEFPPELGFETRYNYVRDYQRDPSL